MPNVIKWCRDFYNWVLGWAEHKWAVPVMCLVAFTEASFFLIPPDIFIIALGASRPKKALIYAFWTTVFSVLGALLGYWIGMTLWDSVKDYMFQFAFKPHHFEIVSQKFNDNTFLAIVIAAFTPIPFKAFTVVGGVLGAPLAPFVAGAIVGRSLRYFLLGGLFFVFGDKIRHWIDDHFEKVTIGVTALVALAIGAYWVFRNGI